MTIDTHRSIHGELRAIPPDSDLCPMLAVEVQEIDLTQYFRAKRFAVQIGGPVLSQLISARKRLEGTTE